MLRVWRLVRGFVVEFVTRMQVTATTSTSVADDVVAEFVIDVEIEIGITG